MPSKTNEKGKVREQCPNYSEEEKRVALETVIACGGNVRKAARTLGIKEATLRTWVNGKKAISLKTFQDFTENARARVEQRLNAMHASKDEVLSLLAEHLRIDVAQLADCFTDKGQLDLKAAQRLGVSRYVKKLKQRSSPVKDADGNVSYEFTTELEIHDPQGAARQLVQVLGMQKEPDANPDRLTREEQKKKAEARLAAYRPYVENAEAALHLLQQDAPELASALVQ